MTLVWKLLRRHVSVPQLAGFFLANLFGMFIVLLGWQFYHDVLPVFSGADSFMKTNYLVVNKQVATTAGFTAEECRDFGAQPFVSRVGQFTSAEYRADARISVDGQKLLSSEIFFESVPDDFIDVPLEQWQWEPLSARHGSSVEIPLILPRSYLTMYNFGFARSRSLPRVSEGVADMLDVLIVIGGDSYHGRVVGFSSRMSTILVPQRFMEWSNARYATGRESLPTRLLVDVSNPADERLTQYLEENGYEVDDNLDAEKTSYFLRLVVLLVMGVGVVISMLSFYILMLSVFLLVQKNTEKMQNLLLIGYSPRQVALPYQVLTVVLNLLVLLLALVSVALVHSRYMETLVALFPEMDVSGLSPSVFLGILLFALVTILNVWVIRRKINQIWKHKN